MERYTLDATRRTLTGKKVAQLRRDGKLPAVLYGRSMKAPVPVTFDRTQASKALRHITYSSLIKIKLEGEEHNTLVRDFQIDTLRGDLTHVDFLVVSLTEKVKTEVGIVMEGKAPVIANLGGLLVPGLERVDVEALPQDLPEHFTVDVSNLANFGDALFVRDLIVPANVTVLTDPDELLVVASAPVAEIVEEVAAVTAPVEGEVPAEGAAPAEGAVPGAEGTAPAASAAPAAAGAAPAPVATAPAGKKEKAAKPRINKEKKAREKEGRGR
jgi:large subunit ribosomal protein L25